jgi:large subunit ribosomal protein L17
MVQHPRGSSVKTPSRPIKILYNACVSQSWPSHRKELRMKKRIAFRKLGRDTQHRIALLRNMVTSLIYHERITTTTPKAKELKRVADKMVTLAKKGTEHHKRQATGFVREIGAVEKLFAILGPRYR